MVIKVQDMLGGQRIFLKARLQLHRDIFPVVHKGSIHVLLDSKAENLSIEQMNVEKTYQNGILRETHIHMSARRLHRRQGMGVQRQRA